MSRKIKNKFEALEQFQIDFITKKTEELGSYNMVVAFYNQKDLVGEFAKETAKKFYKIEEEDVGECGDFEPVAAAPRTTPKKEPVNIRKKRKINVEDIEENE